MAAVRTNSEAADQDGNLIEIGTITKAVGLRGELKIFTLTKSPSDLSHYPSLSVRQSGVLQKLTIEKMRVKGNLAIVKFVGVDSINSAEKFVNSTIFIEPDQLPATESNEYFIQDLLGMNVFDRDGAFLGTLKDVLELPPHDVYVIQQEGREILIPAVKEFVHEIDIKKRRIVVTYDSEMED